MPQCLPALGERKFQCNNTLRKFQVLQSSFRNPAGFTETLSLQIQFKKNLKTVKVLKLLLANLCALSRNSPISIPVKSLAICNVLGDTDQKFCSYTLCAEGLICNWVGVPYFVLHTWHAGVHLLVFEPTKQLNIFAYKHGPQCSPIWGHAGTWVNHGILVIAGTHPYHKLLYWKGAKSSL